MKKLSKVVSISLCVAMGIYPLCALIAQILGYDFRIFSEAVWYLLLLAGTAGCFLLLRKSEQSYAWCGLLPLLALANWLCSMTHGILPVLFSALMLFCTIPILMRHTSVHWLRVTSLGIAGLMCMPLLGISLLGNMVSNSQNNVVVDTKTSPSGTHYFERIENEQTEKEKNIIVIVKVYENSGFDIGICSATKRPEKLYVGEREKEAETEFSVSWKDDTCIVIDGKEYPIN